MLTAADRRKKLSTVKPTRNVYAGVVHEIEVQADGTRAAILVSSELGHLNMEPACCERGWEVGDAIVAIRTLIYPPGGRRTHVYVAVHNNCVRDAMNEADSKIGIG